MGNRKTDVERADAGAGGVERFDFARLLAIADQYAADKPQVGEFATSWFAQQKQWTYDRTMKTLRRLEADGYVTSRKAGRVTLWRINESR